MPPGLQASDTRVEGAWLNAQFFPGQAWDRDEPDQADILRVEKIEIERSVN
jgi:hypothetical protein